MLWLVFSVLRKVIGLLVLAAVAAVAFGLWQNPAMLRGLIDWVQTLV